MEKIQPGCRNFFLVMVFISIFGKKAEPGRKNVVGLKEITEKLADSDLLEVRWKILANVYDEPVTTRRMRDLSESIKGSAISQALLRNKNEAGEIISSRSVYDKWQGAHWILASLADIGYPRGDPSLWVARNQVLNHWLSESFYREFIAKSKNDVYKRQEDGVPLIKGRFRRCASQQGYCLFYLLRLGIEDQRIHDLMERLLHWQWPDGGWNCDKDPSATKSTFIHTALALRGLVEYNKKHDSGEVVGAIGGAAEIFLERKLFRRLLDGSVIKEAFTKLHYPLYWHYDVLGMLKIFSESGHIKDKRCDEAVELLMGKFIDGEGWPAESRFYKTSAESGRDCDYVDWGGTGKKKANPWVSADALYVLKSKGVFTV